MSAMTYLFGNPHQVFLDLCLLFISRSSFRLVIGLKSGLMFWVRFSFGNLDHHVEFRKLEMSNQEADECHAKTWLKIYTNKWLKPYTNEMTKTYTNI